MKFSCANQECGKSIEIAVGVPTKLECPLCGDKLDSEFVYSEEIPTVQNPGNIVIIRTHGKEVKKAEPVISSVSNDFSNIAKAAGLVAEISSIRTWKQFNAFIVAHKIAVPDELPVKLKDAKAFLATFVKPRTKEIVTGGSDTKPGISRVNA